MQEIVKAMLDKLKYRAVGSDYARIGAMAKRYGKSAVIAAINNISEWSFIPTDMINTLEKQCQKTIQKEDTQIKNKIKNLLT